MTIRHKISSKWFSICSQYKLNDSAIKAIPPGGRNILDSFIDFPWQRLGVRSIGISREIDTQILRRYLIKIHRNQVGTMRQSMELNTGTYEHISS